jgi:hypothetical protein
MRPELCAAVGTKEQAGALYAGLLGFRRRHVVYLAAVAASEGSIERLLGGLAQRSGDHAAAREHFEQALVDNLRLGAPQLVAKTREDYALALADSSDVEERNLANQLWRQALDAYRAFDMALDVERVQGLISDFEASWGNSSAVAVPDRRSGSGGSTRVVPNPDFESMGDFWKVSFEGSSVTLKDCDGLRYLAHLVARPRQQLHVLELMAGRRSAVLVERSKEAEGLRLEQASEPVIDGRAVRAYRQRLLELKEELEEPLGTTGSPRGLQLRSEYERLTEALAQSLRFGGQPRHGASTAERARINVTQRIRSAVGRIAEQHPSLGYHLRSTIHTGQFCGYDPPPGR